ncbi:MAG: hypothetical protein B7733_26480 [Myxococcales bacterium FL481]|nr:MAG: hypothetical protein B7733_26480 [Myxococcales bacterium FL481]
MTRWRGAATMALTVALLSGGCVRSLRSDRAAHHEARLREAKPHAAPSPSPMVVVVTERGLSAIDPVNRRELWRSPLQPAGHLAADRTAVYVPSLGPALIALDRETGRILWRSDVPAEALVGVAASEGLIVVTATGNSGSSQGSIVGLAASDGHHLWRRRVGRSPGIPAIAADLVAVPLGRQLVGLRRGLGREVARMDLTPDEPWERAQWAQGSLAVASNRTWRRLDGEPNPAPFVADEARLHYDPAASDPGHDDAERGRWLPVRAAGVDAVLQLRRAVVGLATRADRTAVQWLHVAPEGAEFVAVSGDAERVTLVSETGSMIQLQTVDGAVTWTWRRTQPTAGALFVGSVGALGEPVADESSPAGTIVGQDNAMRALFADRDPRLDPLRQLVLRQTASAPAHGEAAAAERDPVLAQGPQHGTRDDDSPPRNAPADETEAAVRLWCERGDPRDIEALLDLVRIHHGDALAFSESPPLVEATLCLRRHDTAQAELLDMAREPWSAPRFIDLVTRDPGPDDD